MDDDFPIERSWVVEAHLPNTLDVVGGDDVLFVTVEAFYADEAERIARHLSAVLRPAIKFEARQP